jgi:tetratricopeptide (TPR) repeat protein
MSKRHSPRRTGAPSRGVIVAASPSAAAASPGARIAAASPPVTRSLSDLTREAAALYRAGDWRRAEQLCVWVLKTRANDPEALGLIGVIASQTGRASDAVQRLRQALAVRPRDPVLLNNYGQALYLLGRADEALASYERALGLQPDFAAAHNNRGNVLHGLGRALDALDSFGQALAHRPDYPEACYNRGNVLHDLRRYEEALASYEQALTLNPDYVEAWAHRGGVLNELQRYAEALASCEHALTLQPGYAAAHHQLGTALRGLGRLAEALASYERALAVKPEYAEAYHDRGNVLRDLNRLDEALQSYAHALAIKPELAEAHNNRGIVLHELLRVDEAVAAYTRALTIRPEYAEAHSHRAMARLLVGALVEGWAEHEWRWKVERIRRAFEQRGLSQPLWLGESDLAGKTILLHSEQGLGDTIQFCRYAPLVARLGARVILEVPRAVSRLLAGLPGVAQLCVQEETTGREPELLPAFDYHCPLLSLPLAFRTSLQTIPVTVPYLTVPAERLAYWQRTLGERRRLRVGLVWSGGFRPGQPEFWSLNARRNVPLAQLAPLRHADIEFYSLQKGEPAESELAELLARHWEGPALIDHTSELHDFADTAALMQQLDLVISVDTSTAHLAGALGKPVWILNRFDTCWRWLLDRSDSPWYPTAKLYRQERPCEWDGVVQRVGSDLEALVESWVP